MSRVEAELHMGHGVGLNLFSMLGLCVLVYYFCYSSREFIRGLC